MPTIAPGDLTILRAGRHKVHLYASILQPRTLWTARVDDAGIGIGERTIAFDTGVGSHWDWVEGYQTLHVGTAPGLVDIGRVRIKSVASGSAGASGTVEVAANSLNWSNNLYLTFLHNYELWSIFPRIDASEIFYKDYDVTYSDQNEEMRPICIAGPHRARFSEFGVGYTYNIPIGLSYSLSPGATIVSHTVSIKPDTVGITVGAMVGNNIPVFIPDGNQYGGQYWVKATVTDSNGHSQSTWRSIFHHRIGQSSGSYPVTEIESAAVSGDWDAGGWTGRVVLREGASVTEIPEGTLFLLWGRHYFNDTEYEVTTRDYARNIFVAGYARNDQYNRRGQNGGNASFTITTIDDLLRNRGLFSVSLESKDDPEKWYEYLNGYLTAGRIVHHFYKYHSTLFEVADFYDLDDDGAIQRKAADIERGTLYNMPDNLVRNQGIYAHLASSKAGEMKFARDLIYRNDATRAAATVVADFDSTDFRDSTPVIVHHPFYDTSFVFVSGIAYNGSTAVPIGSTAPSEWPASFGSKIVHVERQMMTNQADSNELAGQIFAVENNEFPEVRVDFSGNYSGVVEVVDQEWWRMTINPSETVREIIFTTKRMICRHVDFAYTMQLGIVDVSAVFIPEADGTPGVPYEWPDEVPGGGGDPPEIPSSAVAALLSAASLYYQPYGDATWQLRTTDPLNDIALDPYWLLKAPAAVATNAIVMSSEEGRIRRSVNSGISFSTLSPGDPPNDYGDAPAPTLANCSIIQCAPNYALNQTFAWLVIWENAGGIWRSWYLSTDDDGSTFDWNSV